MVSVGAGCCIERLVMDVLGYAASTDAFRMNRDLIAVCGPETAAVWFYG